MGTLILIILLIAAVFGVLGGVLKVALIIALSVTLAVVGLASIAVWSMRRRLRAWQRELERRTERERRRRNAYDVGSAGDQPDEGPTGALGSGG